MNRKKMKFYLLALTFCFCHLMLLGQHSTIDSLLIVLKSDNADTNKLIHLIKLSDEYHTISNFSNELYYGNQALLLADLIVNNDQNESIRQTARRFKALAYNNIGNVYYNQYNYQEALKHYFLALRISEAIGDKNNLEFTYGIIGEVYSSLGNYPEALKNYFSSLKIGEAIDKIYPNDSLEKKRIKTSANSALEQ